MIGLVFLALAAAVAASSIWLERHGHHTACDWLQVVGFAAAVLLFLLRTCGVAG